MSRITEGMMALYPVYLARAREAGTDDDAYNSAVAINESNLNQNLELLFARLAELEEAIASLNP